MKKSRFYKIKTETRSVVQFDWKKDKEGDWQLEFYNDWRWEYWGMVCPHYLKDVGHKIVRDGNEWDEHPKILAKAKRIAEDDCARRAMKHTVEVEEAE